MTRGMYNDVEARETDVWYSYGSHLEYYDIQFSYSDLSVANFTFTIKSLGQLI